MDKVLLKRLIILKQILSGCFRALSFGGDGWNCELFIATALVIHFLLDFP